MKYKALDTLHVSSVGPENIAPGGEFEVSDADGKSLVDRGLAKAVGGKAKDADKPAEKPRETLGVISGASVPTTPGKVR